MWVALRMHVAHRARDLPGRDLQDPDVGRCIEVAVRARLNLRVAAAVDERRQPADLQLAADDDEQVRAADLEDEARLRIDEVRVLVPLGEGDDRDLVAADLARQRGQIFGRGDDAHGRGTTAAADRRERRREQHESNEDSHVVSSL